MSEFSVPIEDVVSVEESEYTESDYESEKEVDEDIDKSVVAQRAKAKARKVVSTKKGTTKGVLIKKLASTNRIKRKREDSQSSKVLAPSPKTARSSKGFGIYFKGPGPRGKVSSSRGKGKVLIREERKEILKIREVLRGYVFDPKIVVMPGMAEIIEIVKFKTWEHLFLSPCSYYLLKKVRMFYHNLTFSDDTLYLTSQVHDANITLDEQLLAKVLGVPIQGTKSLKDDSGSEKFLNHIDKLDDFNIKSGSKKSLKREF